ncbi:winged helix-turn-helix transcriptional regulator [Streptomyces sp. NPDC048305]|uniref:winged helix-turn-helix transcriptional regulator n=1 Tax=Streptomyces sp. NPDC048305 TaxID=3365532 RepID=UPI00371610BC
MHASAELRSGHSTESEKSQQWRRIVRRSTEVPNVSAETTCPVERSLDQVGDRWSLLIVWEALNGACRFGEFHRNLGLGKNILSARLSKLVSFGVFRMQPASDGSSYQEYVLTEKGRSLRTVILALRQWGE